MAILCSKEEFSSLYKELLSKTDSILMQVKGGSMYPFIKSGDRIELEPVKNGSFIKKGDIILFRKDNYFYVHRIIKKKGQNFITRGDFSFGNDGKIPQKDILAKVVSVERNGRRINLYSKLNRFIGICLANFGFFLQYIALFLRRLINLGFIFLSRLQRIKFFRRFIKKISVADILIRNAQEDDQEQLRDLYLVGMADIADGLVNTLGNGFWLVAQRNGKIAGAFSISRYEKDEKIWLIFGLVVKPLLRGLGIGEKLVCQALIKAKEAGAGEIGLFVNKKSKAAINLYKKIGFKTSVDYPPDFNIAKNELYLRYKF